MDKINAIEGSLNNLQSTTNTIKQEHIDDLVNSISTFFTDHAKDVFGEKITSNRENCYKNKQKNGLDLNVKLPEEIFMMLNTLSILAGHA